LMAVDGSCAPPKSSNVGSCGSSL